MKWVNVHECPKFLWIVSCCQVWRVLRGVNVHYFTEFCFWRVLKGVSLCCYIARCLDSSCPIHFVQWCTTLLVAPWWTPFCWAPWGSLLCPWGSPWAAWFSWAPWWTLLFCAPWGSLLSPWESPWAAGSASCLALCCWGWIFWLCMSCSLWVLLPIYGWGRVWNET